MPEYDWLASDEFKKKIGEKAEETGRELGLVLHETVVPFLIVMLNKYLDENMHSELGKPIWESRTPKDAFYSVSILIKEASKRTKNRQSNMINLNDILQAHANKFCRVWPFCGTKGNTRTPFIHKTRNNSAIPTTTE